MLTQDAIHLTTLTDSYGEPLAEYYYFPTNAVLFVQWHGQLTSDEVIRGAKLGTELLEKYPFQRILSDKHDTGGDWGEALDWFEYEWGPLAAKAGLRAIAYILSPDLAAQLVSRKFVEAMQESVHVSLFTNRDDAQNWLETQ